MLTENPWEGGGGHTIEEVGQMTLDQIWFRLCDKKLLEGNPERRVTKTLPMAVEPGKDGMIKGRDKHGNPILGRITGKSKARRLMEAEAERIRLKQEEVPEVKRLSKREKRRARKREQRDGT